MTEKRWSFNGGVIVGTDICEEGIPHTNRSIVTHLNRYERKIRELEEENGKLKQLLDLFASDICKVTELLDENNIEYELYNDVENFIVKWGVRIE